MLESGDLDGYAVWRRIGKAVRGGALNGAGAQQ